MKWSIFSQNIKFLYFQNYIFIIVIQISRDTKIVSRKTIFDLYYYCVLWTMKHYISVTVHVANKIFLVVVTAKCILFISLYSSCIDMKHIYGVKCDIQCTWYLMFFSSSYYYYYYFHDKKGNICNEPLHLLFKHKCHY